MITFEQLQRRGRRKILGFVPLDGSEISLEMLREMRDHLAVSRGLLPREVAIVNRQRGKLNTNY